MGCSPTTERCASCNTRGASVLWRITCRRRKHTETRYRTPSSASTVTVRMHGRRSCRMCVSLRIRCTCREAPSFPQGSFMTSQTRCGISRFLERVAGSAGNVRREPVVSGSCYLSAGTKQACSRGRKCRSGSDREFSPGDLPESALSIFPLRQKQIWSRKYHEEI